MEFIPSKCAGLQAITNMFLELGAQIHRLQLLGGIKWCLSSRAKAWRNVFPRESHRLEVCLRQLVVEILLQDECYKSAKCHDRHLCWDSALLTQAKIPAGLAPSKTESLASQD